MSCSVGPLGRRQVLHPKTITLSAAKILSPRHQVPQARIQFPKTRKYVCAIATPATKSPARLREILRQGQNDWPCVAPERIPSQDPWPVPQFLLVLSYSAQLPSDTFRGLCRPAP